MSKLATNKCGEERNRVGVMDVKSTFLYGRARRRIFIEVPTEDPRSQLDGVLAQLVGSLYGTRDAPLIWQDLSPTSDEIAGDSKNHFVSNALLYHETKGVEMIATR